MIANRIIIGTRGSELALSQTRWVMEQLSLFDPQLQLEISIIKTAGDKILDSPLSKIGDKGLFTREIEHALLDHKIDIAVHSLKDIPTQTPDGLMIGAITEREDVRDVFISHKEKKYQSITQLPPGAKVATGSLRRRCQFRHLRPDIDCIEIRGNLQTRLQKLNSSNWDGMVLAFAGVRRLKMDDCISFFFQPDEILPAVGQGTLGIEIRNNDERIQSIVNKLNHQPTASATLAERAFLRTLEGGCQIPIGAYGKIIDGQLHLDGMVGSLDGNRILRDNSSGSLQHAEQLGVELARKLLSRGAGDILDSIRGIA